MDSSRRRISSLRELEFLVIAEAIDEGVERIAFAPCAHPLLPPRAKKDVRRLYLARVGYFLVYRISPRKRTTKGRSFAPPALTQRRASAAALPARRPKKVPSPNDIPLE